MAAMTALGRGFYGIAEAARLVKLEESRVRRWTKGYRAPKSRHWMPPLVGFDGVSRQPASSLSFADLIKIRHLEHFIVKGVSIRYLRAVVESARIQLNTSHPFGTHRFVTDGRSILRDVSKEFNYAALENIITSQLESEKFIESMLKGELDFDDQDVATRWWPLTKKRDVVIDPQRRFGAPISHKAGIPTSILARAYRAEGSFRAVASWHSLPWQSVRDAVVFENKLAA